MSNVTFAVMPFSRERNGKLIPGDAVEAANGEIAWRMAQALAKEHGYVGAAAFSRTGPPRPVSIAECAMLACFGDVDLQAVAG